MPSGKRINWLEHDDLIRQHLPSMTIEEFTRTHLPGISSKAVGARARKLGIKPKQYCPTAEHKAKIAARVSKDSPELIKRIAQLRDSMSLRLLASSCGISVPTLVRLNKHHNIGLSEAGMRRALAASKSATKGKAPWNKGKQLPEAMKIKMAEGRRRMSGRLSDLQAAFYRILDENHITYYRDHEPECRFGPWTFDCRIVHGARDLLVEVQGGYIYSLPKTVAKDQAKATYMERYHPGLPIKYVWEHEFGAANRVKQQVRRWLGLEQPTPVEFTFRDVELRPITEADAATFLAAFHYLGKLAGRIKLGAYLGDQLVAVSVWSAPTRAETAARLGCHLQNCLELRRFVIHDSYHKPNFGSWLLARAEALLPANITHLVSFADPGVDHDGTVYRAANWTADGVTEPSYFYMDGEGYVLLKKTVFNLANKMHMKEADYAETYGYTKVKTPPKFRFYKRLKSAPRKIYP